ncbi:glycosyltransferase [Egicoccus halophilus]|uniref:Glycosyl transferase n=1 Tax=Egicoccus halophilus TaxID=1670830 RepID=A0A8J3AG64_9ACTN|nr:glycosyltransferase [Egicoccus halophilus]GGI08618.1 glycosyl transferase [Egicoccus halophilus]
MRRPTELLTRRPARRRTPRRAVAPGDPVLLVDLARWFGGTENRVLHLATSLRARGYRVHVVCSAQGMLLPRLRDVGVDVLPLAEGRGDPRVLLRLVTILRRLRPVVVDTHGVHSQFWGMLAATLCRTPSRVVTVHSEYGREQAGLRRGRFYDFVLQASQRVRARFVAVSQPVRAYLHELGVDDRDIQLIWNAVPLPDPADFGDRDTTRRQLGVPQDAFVCTTVARLHPSKGHRFFVEALAGLAERRPNLHWVVVGQGGEEAALRQRVRELGLEDRVHLVGFRDDVTALLHASDVFVLPSLAEGLPLVVAEATLQRTPVLACAVGGLPHVYDQEEVWLVPPQDPAALAAAVERLIDEPDTRAELARRGEQATRERLLTETMIDETLETYVAAGTG